MKRLKLKVYQKLIDAGDEAKAPKDFEKLLLQTSTRILKTKKIEDLSLSNFVELENCIESNNYLKFCGIFVRKKFWQTLYFSDLQNIITDFGQQKKELFENYTYIFDPPIYGEPTKETVGSELRKDFVDEFGTWVVLTDLVCKGKIVDYKAVERWKLSEFLFWANYLSGQKIIENVK